MDKAVNVRFGGDTRNLNAAVDEARQTLARFAPQSTSQANASLDALRSSLDRNTDALQSNASGWRANLQAAANFVIVLGGIKRAVEEIVAVEIGGDVILARSFARINAMQSQVNGDAFAALGVGATTAVAQVEDFSQRAATAFDETKAQLVDLMKQYHLMIATAADARAIMAVAAAGGLDALEVAVGRATATTRAAMAEMEAAYQRAMVQRDPATGRETGNAASLAAEQDVNAETREPDGGLYTAHLADIAALQANIKSVDETLRGFIADLQKIPETSNDVATAIEASFTTLPGYTLEANAAMIEFLTSIAANGAEAQELGVQLKAALLDGEHGGAALAAMFAKVGDAEDRVGKSAAFGKLLQPAQAVAFYAAIKDGIDRQKAGLAAVDADYLAQQGKLNAVGRFLEGIVGTTKAEHEANQATLGTLQTQSDELGKQVGLYSQLADKARQLKEFAEALKAAGDTPSASLATLTKRRDALDGRPQQKTMAEAGVSAVERDTLARLAILEAGGEGAKGIEMMVNVVRNRLQNGGFGDSLQEVMSKPKQFTAYKPDRLAAINSDSDAYRQALDIVNRQLGSDANPDATKGATHYLNIDDATDKSWVDKMTNVTSYKKHTFGNVDTDPVLSDSDEVRRREAVEKTSTAIRQQQDLIAGGTATERLKVDLAEKGLTQARDAVAEAQQLVDVARKGVDAAQDGTPQERAKARAALVQAETELRSQEVARDRAAEALKTAALREGTQARYEAELAALTKQEDAEVKGSAKWSEIEEKKRALTERFETAKVASAKAAEDLVTARAKEGSAEQYSARLAAIDVELKAATAGTAKAIELEKQRVEVQKSYDASRVAAARAAEDLVAARAVEGSKEQLAAKLAGIDIELAATAAGTAKAIDLEKQKVELLRAAAHAATADTVAEEAVRYDALKKGFTAEQEAIKDNTRLMGASVGEEYAGLLASYGREAAAARAHFAELARYYADDPKQYRAAMRGKAEVDAQLNAQRLAAERSLQSQLLEQYKSTYEAIGSTVSSGIMGMIEKTTTLRQVGQNVARQLLQQFIEARVRMVADWAAGETAKILATTAGETAKTTAVAAGEAARTGLVDAGAAAQAATKATSIIGSILASAQETFAGVFGFLSPIMGPLAAGPAAAAEAVVAAKAALPSFAVGAWSLPSDMVAQVHAGEMIVPAGPAALMRAVAGGGAGSSGGISGGDTHVHLNVQAWDAQSVAGWLRGGGDRLIAKAIGAHHRLNPTTR